MTAEQPNKLQINAKTARVLPDCELNHIQQYQSAIWQHINDAVVIIDSNLHVLAVNSAFETITGFSHHEVMGQNVGQWRSGLMNKRFYHQLFQTLDAHGVWQGEIWHRRKNGSPFPAHLAISKQTLPVSGYVAIMRDLSAQKEAENHIHNHIHYDMLTNLPNRLLFAQTLTNLCSHSDSFALMVLNINGMKTINTSMDHFTGDEILCSVAHRLSSKIDHRDMLARTGAMSLHSWCGVLAVGGKLRFMPKN